MASLQQIISWFKEGLFPTEDQFRQTWLSYWHKSEKIPQSQIFGLQETIEAATRGLIYHNPVTNVADLYTTYPNAKVGWAAMVTSEGYIYSYNGTDWANTGLKEFPDDVITKEDLPEYEQMGDATAYIGTAILNANGTPSNPVSATRLQVIIPNMDNPIVRIIGGTTNSSVAHQAYLTVVKPDNTQINLVSKPIVFNNNNFDLTLSYLDKIDYEIIETRIIIQATNITVSVTTTLTNIYLPIGVKNDLMFNDTIDYLPIMSGYFNQTYQYSQNTSPNTNVCVNRYPVKAGEKFIYSGRSYWNGVFIVKEDNSIVDIIKEDGNYKGVEFEIPTDGYLCCWSINYLSIAKVSLSYNSNQGYAVNPRISLLEKQVEGLKGQTGQIAELSTQLNTLSGLIDVTENTYKYRTNDNVIVTDNQYHSARIGIRVPVASLNEKSKVYLQVKSLNAVNPGSFYKYASTSVGNIVWATKKVNGYYYSNIQEYSFTKDEIQANAQDGKLYLFIQVYKNPLSPDELFISENSYIKQSVSQLVTGSFDLFGYSNSKILNINAGTVATRLSAKIPVELFNNKDLDVYLQFQAANNTNSDKASLYYNSTNVGVLTFNATKQTELYKLTIPFSATAGTDFVDVILQFYNASGLQADTITWLQFYMIGNRIDLLEKQVEELQKGGNTTLIQKTFEIPFRGYSAMTPIKVKKDGSGDYTTIQDAINSIKDASVLKQYDIQVYDDFEITDLTKLHIVNNPNQKNTSANEPTSSIALVITKDWVHIRGMSGEKRLYIESPNDLANGSFQNIQTIYPMGNSGIDNFYVGIKGGRYAIHQESGGSKTHLDYHAHTLYQNLFVEHKGNQDYPNGSGWTSVMAQANGTTSGTKMTYINCKWVAPHATPFYTHTNDGFDEPNDLTMINCSMVSTLKNITVASFGAYWGDIGSGKKSIIKFIGCNIPRFSCMGGGSSRGLEQTMTTANLYENGGSRLLGYGNTPMAVNSWTPSVLSFETINVNTNIEVIGGTAKDLIFGDIYKSYLGTIDAKGLVLGSVRIENPQTWASANPSQIFGLPYRLGNCAANPKTLIIKVDGTNYTITFNKNYMTANGSAYSWNTSPAINNSAIISDINAAYPAIFKAYFAGSATEIGTFEDCQEIGINIDTVTLLTGQSVVRDYTGIQAWKRATEGNIAEGIVAERINVQSGTILNTGRIVLAKKALFLGSLLGAVNISGGKMYKVNSNGYLSETTDKESASFIAIDNNYLKGI